MDSSQFLRGISRDFLRRYEGGTVIVRLATVFVLLSVTLALPLPSGAMVDGPRSWTFAVHLDDSRIGYHRFDVLPAGEGVEVISEARFDVKFLHFSIGTAIARLGMVAASSGSNRRRGRTTESLPYSVSSGRTPSSSTPVGRPKRSTAA